VAGSITFRLRRLTHIGAPSKSSKRLTLDLDEDLHRRIKVAAASAEPQWSKMSNKEKRARFRELAEQERIRTGHQLADDLAQPFLPLFNDILTDVEKCSARPTSTA
jgi:hypothetical protein